MAGTKSNGAPDGARESENGALLDRLSKVQAPHLIEVTRGSPDKTQILVVPEGMEGFDIKAELDAYLPRPERRTGTAVFTSLQSFIDHTQRFADKDSVIFADDSDQRAQLLSVLNYHRAGASGTPEHGDHRALYRFPFSPEWLAWKNLDRKELTQRAFAEFVEDRIADVLDPTEAGESVFAVAERHGFVLSDAARLLGLAKGLSVAVNAKVANHSNLATGEGRVQFEVTHAGMDGAPLSVPGGFGVILPVFKGGPLYKLAVRLRYRVNVETRAISWTLVLHRVDLVFNHALGEAIELVKEQTGLPVLLGTPESGNGE